MSINRLSGKNKQTSENKCISDMLEQQQQKNVIAAGNVLLSFLEIECLLIKNCQ